MKGYVKATIVGVALTTMTACSSTIQYKESSTYKVPKWYDDCQQYTTDEWYKLFWAESNLVGCGVATDGFEDFSKSTAIMNAKAKIADRVNGIVSSEASLMYHNDVKDNKLERTNKIQPSTLKHYEIIESLTYPYQGKFVTFVKIKVPEDQVNAFSTSLPNQRNTSWACPNRVFQQSTVCACGSYNGLCIQF